jgi:6-pyruvoyltetrahydropterin/6-carboxytetrahydropterin synthase
MGHENKCMTLHGHNYYVSLTAEADQLDSVGRVIDFAVLKNIVGQWIDEHWDHTTLVFEEDTKTLELLNQMPGNKPPFVCSFNPTAENMASYLLQELCPKLLDGSGVTVTLVHLEETQNCSATARLS